jgi:hypothetical protein
MIPQADITARLTAKDPQGNFFCARCTIELATQLGFRVGAQAKDPPAGLPGKTLVLSREDLERSQAQRPGSSSRLGAATRASSAKLPRVEAPAEESGASRPSSGKHPRVDTATRSGSGTRTGSVPRLSAETRTSPPGERRSTATRLKAASPSRKTATVPSSRRMKAAEDGGADAEAPETGAPAEGEGGGEEQAPRRLNRKLVLGLYAGGGAILLGALVYYVVARNVSEKTLRQRIGLADQAFERLDELKASVDPNYDMLVKLARECVEKAAGTTPARERRAAAEYEQIKTVFQKTVTLSQVSHMLDRLERDMKDAKAYRPTFKEYLKTKAKLDPKDASVARLLKRIERDGCQAFAQFLLVDVRRRIQRDPGARDAALPDLSEALQAARLSGDASLAQEITADLDAVALAKYTKDFEEKIPWIDLLAPDWRPQWKKSTPPEAIDVKMTDKDVLLTGQEVLNARYGAVAVGLDKGWRDYVLELEFVVEVKRFFVLGRCAPADEAIEYPLEAGEKTGLKTGRPYTMRVSFKGSKGKVEIPECGIDTVRIPPKAAEAGGIGLGVGPGDQVRVKACRIRVLRATP